MDTAVWILIIALVLVALAAFGFFIYKYYLEPHHVLDGIFHHESDSMPQSAHSINHTEGSSSMAGHLVGKMRKAKTHSRKAARKIDQAKAHLDKAQAHAATA